jgi:hypothetical protein
VIFLAIWLLGVGIADVVRWDTGRSWGRSAAGAAAGVVVVIGAPGLVGFTAGEVIEFGLPASVALVGWIVMSKAALTGTGTGTGTGTKIVAAPLAVLVVSVAGLLAANGHAPYAAGRLGGWYSGLDIDSLRNVRFDHFSLAVSGFVFLQSSANVVVRLVLVGAGTPPETGESTLRGGRILGAMERTFIFALGLAGELTAAAIIVAAKGLIRFPEMREAKVKELTEYFLVGSLASWLLALMLLPVIHST